jgi:hypothetical protein
MNCCPVLLGKAALPGTRTQGGSGGGLLQRKTIRLSRVKDPGERDMEQDDCKHQLPRNHAEPSGSPGAGSR